MNSRKKRIFKRNCQLLYFGPHAEPDAPRMLALMQGWWLGRSQAAMADEFGISQQRVSAILRWVGCTKALRCKAKRGQPRSNPRATQTHITAANKCLLSVGFERLTPRQRCAVAWQASGLVLVQIAERMAVTPQAVQQFLLGARRRLAAQNSKQVHDDIDLTALNWDEILGPLGSPGH